MHKSAVLIMLICPSSRHKYLQRRLKDRERKSASCVCVCLCLSSNGIQFKFNKVWICVLCLNSNSNVSKIEREKENEAGNCRMPHATSIKVCKWKHEFVTVVRPVFVLHWTVQKEKDEVR